MQDELTDIEKGFVDYFVKAWGDFNHSYIPPKSKKRWSCTSLADAAKIYIWKKANRGEKNKQLQDLSSRLRKFLDPEQKSDHHDLHHICLEILEWGGVEGISSAWMRVSCSNGVLGEKINKAVELLKAGPDHKEWTRFSSTDIVMNSGLTKIYALADPDNIPIYDGRVGAGMGLLARKYIEQLCPGPKGVPKELAFQWGEGQRPTRKGVQHPRDPSSKDFVFNKLRPSENDHELCCWRTGRILRAVVKKINEGGQQKVTMRDIEDALFMIGRVVYQQP